MPSAASGTTIRVVGYREAAMALGAVNRSSKRVLYAGLRDAARPIVDDIRGRLSDHAGISLGTINPSATVKGVQIRQRKGKVTGLRPDFGVLQMSEGFIPAAAAGQDGIIPRVEAAYAALITTEGL